MNTSHTVVLALTETQVLLGYWVLLLSGQTSNSLCCFTSEKRGARIERQTRDRKVASSNPGRSGGRIFFSGVNFLCWLLFRYPFHRRVTAAVCKKYCHSAKVQVAGYSYLRSLEWEVTPCTGARLCGVHRTCDETAAVSDAASTPLRCIFKKALGKATVHH